MFLTNPLKSRFALAEESRDSDETRWLEAYENYRGLYGKRVKFRESEKSRVFVKVTKTKVLAAFGQLVDVLFGTGKFPIGISETKISRGSNRIGIIAACIYYACKECEVPRSTNELSSLFQIDNKIMTKGCKNFTEIIGKNH